jgi:hypothetical protein
MKPRLPEQFVIGYRPVIHARSGLMLGIRQPLDGPIFETKQDAEVWCMNAMASHYDRRLGLSDARIYPYKGMAACFPDPPRNRIYDIERILGGRRADLPIRGLT